MRRKNSLRLEGYDYSSVGCYFVTFCTKGRQKILSSIDDGKVSLLPLGRFLLESLQQVPVWYPNSMTDTFVIMPDHVHVIFRILAPHVGVIHESPLREGEVWRDMSWYERRTMLLSKVIGKLKMITAKKYNRCIGSNSVPVWQRGFYERILEDDCMLFDAREYIARNPLEWRLTNVDTGNPR